MCWKFLVGSAAANSIKIYVKHLIEFVSRIKHFAFLSCESLDPRFALIDIICPNTLEKNFREQAVEPHPKFLTMLLISSHEKN